MTPADRDILALSERLGLAYAPQDWGIANADPRRVSEFMRACRDGPLTPPQQYAMGELVLASMNEAFADGLADTDLTREFRDFLGLDLHGLPAQLRYWSSLADGNEFPLAGLLGREVVAG